MEKQTIKRKDEAENFIIKGNVTHTYIRDFRY